MSTALAADTTVGTDTEALRRKELATFLRSRRERISPDEVGINTIGRRRTPGLRREEVAHLAGVGVTWYTWLEQGRDINASEQVLAAIARTLQLTRDEQAHLFTLAGAPDPTVSRECTLATAGQRAVLDQLAPWPACLQSGKYDLLAYNRPYRFLVEDLDALPTENRNAFWMLFAEPEWRRALPDWAEIADQMVANLRQVSAEHVADATWKALIARVRAASPEFVEMWQRHEVRGFTPKVKRYRNPHVGMLRFEVVHNWLAPRAGGRMNVYVPADAATEKKLITLEELHACS